MDGQRSVAFDRIADSYDETRGGVERGADLAREIAPHLRPGAVAEVGAGTGAVALPLTGLGHPVLGFDLSAPMLRHARDRLGSRVAAADGYHLPVRAASVPNVVIVWMLHLVPEMAPLLADVHRVLAPGGRLATVPAGSQAEHDDIGEIVQAMHANLRGRRSRPDEPATVIAAAESADLALGSRVVARGEAWWQSPEEQAGRIAARSFSSLWDVPDDRWAAVVEPAIAALRALPEPDRPRERRTRYELLVFDRP
jgi:SAM-dependent methyltransferase